MGKITAGDNLVWVYKPEGSTAIKTPVPKKRVPVYCEDVRVVKFAMKGIVPARTSARLQGGMTGHAACKKFELSRVVYDEILRGLPTDINITLTYRHGANPHDHIYGRYMCSGDINVADIFTGGNHLYKPTCHQPTTNQPQSSHQRA